MFKLSASHFEVEFEVEYNKNMQDFSCTLRMSIPTAQSPIVLPAITTVLLPIELKILINYLKEYGEAKDVGEIMKHEYPYVPYQLAFQCHLLGGEVWQCDQPEDLIPPCGKATILFLVRNYAGDDQLSGYIGAEASIELSEIRSFYQYLTSLGI